MKSLALSVQGKKSEVNEDSFAALLGAGVFVVADGVGGGPGGKDASKIVTNTAFDFFGDKAVSDESIRLFVSKANKDVLAHAKQTHQQGMASTVVLAWIDGKNLSVYHAGDSRAYVFSNGLLECVTVDHSTLLKRPGRADKNVVTRAIGVRELVEPDVFSRSMLQPFSLLLVSDGISDPLGDEEIREVLTQEHLSLLEKVRILIKNAEEKGGQDDKTVILVSAT